MEGILSFLSDNYIWFMIGAGVLLLALIGFLVDSKKKKKTETMTPMTNSDPVVPGVALPTDTPVSTPVENVENASVAPVTEEPSLVFEEPSLQNNNGQNVSFDEPQVVQEPVAEEPTVIPTPSIFDTPSEESAPTIGEPISASDSVVNEEPVMSEPVVSEPVTQEPVAPVAPTVEPTVIPTETPVVPTVAEPTTPEAPAVQDINSQDTPLV